MIKTFDLNGFLLGITQKFNAQRQYSHPERKRFILPLHPLRAVHSEFRQVLLWTNSRRDCYIAPSSRKSSQIPFPPFTELHTLSLILLGACRTLRDFVTRHIGLDGNLSHQFEYRVQTRFRICLVLLHISMQVV